MTDEFIEDISNEVRFEEIRDKGFLEENGHHVYNYDIYDCMWNEGQVGSNFCVFNGRNSISLSVEGAKKLVTILEYYLAKIEDCKVVISEATKKEDG